MSSEIETRKVICFRGEWKRVKELFLSFGWWAPEEGVKKWGPIAIIYPIRDHRLSPKYRKVYSLIWLERLFVLVFNIRKFIGVLITVWLAFYSVCALIFGFTHGFNLIIDALIIAIIPFIIWLLLRGAENRMAKKAEDLAIKNGFMDI